MPHCPNSYEFYEYLMQRSLKLGGTNYNFRLVKLPGTSPY